tara:strand:+ start:4962 stop:5255 length:294 start_codon:yes stop_codon:yes gene_type:complete
VLILRGKDKYSCIVLNSREKSVIVFILIGRFRVLAFSGKITNLPGDTVTCVPPTSANEVSENELAPNDISISSKYIHNIEKKPPLSERLSRHRIALS